MGGTGSRYYGRTSRQKLAALVNEANADVSTSDYNAAANDILHNALGDYNNRDVAAIRAHIETIQNALEKDIESSLDLVFGGSISKNTHVNGLSDADLLVKISSTSLEGKSPSEVLEYFAGQLRERLPNTKVEVGTLAVTIKYSDGHTIQVLPAISTATGLRIATAEGRSWSNVIRPDAFAKKLTDVNQNCGGKVVPVIKLFKAVINKEMPANAKLSGYHVESLAIEAFDKYDGRRTYKDMLFHLCRAASERVKSPITDTTGQSLHVDEDLGAANSNARRLASASLERLSQRMDSADKKQDTTFWMGIFGDE